MTIAVMSIVSADYRFLYGKLAPIVATLDVAKLEARMGLSPY